MLVFAIFGLVLLIACWLVGDLRWTTKGVFTLLFLGSFGLLFIPGYAFLFAVAQASFIAVAGATTFGLEWLMRDVR